MVSLFGSYCTVQLLYGTAQNKHFFGAKSGYSTYTRWQNLSSALARARCSSSPSKLSWFSVVGFSVSWVASICSMQPDVALADAVSSFAHAVRSLVPFPSSHLATHHVPRMLIALLGEPGGAPKEAQLDAIETLSRLARSSSAQAEAIRDADAVPTLVDLLKSIKDEPSARHALIVPIIECLTDIAKTGRAAQVKVREAGGIAPLVALCAMSEAAVEDRSAQLTCAVRALTALASGMPELQKAIREEAGVPPLVDLLDSEAPLNALSAAALATLAADKECCDQIFEAQGLPKLIKLLGDPAGKVAAEAAHCLKAISFRSAVDRDQIRELGGVAPLVALLSMSGAPGGGDALIGDECASWAAGALRHMAYTNVANCDAIREAGGIGPLVGLLNGRDSPHAAKAEEDAAGALWNLTEHSSANCFALLDTGLGVRSLVSILARETQVHDGFRPNPLSIPAPHTPRAFCPSPPLPSCLSPTLAHRHLLALPRALPPRPCTAGL